MTLDYQIPYISQQLQNLTDTKHRFSLHRFSFFGGWKWSNTNVNAINITLETGELLRDEIIFDTTGPFIGIADSWALDSKNNHWLGISVVGGQISGHYNFSSILGEKRFPSTNAIDPTFVLRYGFSIKGLLLNLFADNRPIGQLTYTLSLDHYNYSMDLDGANFSTLDRPFVEETMDSFNASLITNYLSLSFDKYSSITSDENCFPVINLPSVLLVAILPNVLVLYSEPMRKL